MSTHSGFHGDTPDLRKHHHTEVFGFGQVRTVVALTVIALGLVFFLAEAKVLDYSSNWWVIFIAIPGLGLLWGAYENERRAGKWTATNVTQVVLGLVALLLTLIFIFDPQWTFTHGWKLDVTFPFLRDVQWDRIWPWALVLPGAAIVYASLQQRSVGGGLFGVALMVVGAVFILNISWNAVWPLAIVVVGVGLLLFNRPARE